jgi:hypothetical protein
MNADEEKEEVSCAYTCVRHLSSQDDRTGDDEGIEFFFFLMALPALGMVLSLR